MNSEINDEYQIPTLTDIICHEWAVDSYCKNYTKFKCSECGMVQVAFEDSPCTWLVFNKDPCIKSGRGVE